MNGPCRVNDRDVWVLDDGERGVGVRRYTDSMASIRERFFVTRCLV